MLVASVSGHSYALAIAVMCVIALIGLGAAILLPAGPPRLPASDSTKRVVA